MRPARRSRWTGILVAAAALVLSTIGPASFADLSTASPAPPYLSGLGTDFYASANKAWSGAKELTPDASNNPLSKPAGKGDPDTFIWTKACSKKAQTARFTRTLKLPGKPTTASFYIASLFPSGVATPFQSYSLEINGTKAVKGALTGAAYSGSTLPLPPTAIKAFKNGENLVEVVVKRGALAKGKSCNTSDADEYGVDFRFSGKFAADLALFDAPVQTVIYKKGGSTNTTIENISVRNLGPSGLVAGGTFWLKVTGVKAVLNLSDSTVLGSGPFPSSPPFDACTATTTSPVPNLTVEISCTLGAMPAGSNGVISIGTLQEFASVPVTSTSTFLQWKVGHPGDSTYDNQRSVQYVFCGSQSTTPGCLALG